MRAVILGVVFSLVLLSVAAGLQAEVQQSADSILPDSFLKFTPGPASEEQRKWERAEQRQTYERDKFDPRRAARCI
jgi:ABC-type lipoprotein release transport system permease subunit